MPPAAHGRPVSASRQPPQSLQQLPTGNVSSSIKRIRLHPQHSRGFIIFRPSTPYEPNASRPTTARLSPMSFGRQLDCLTPQELSNVFWPSTARVSPMCSSRRPHKSPMSSGRQPYKSQRYIQCRTKLAPTSINICNCSSHPGSP